MSHEEPLLHVGRPNTGDRDRFLDRVHAIFDDRWLTNRGPNVIEFEEELARYLNVKHCITICNGTVALEIAVRALGLTGEVLLPSFTFIATAHALQWQEITPVFCDISSPTYCIDPAEVERQVTSRTTGIIGVHLYAQPCDVDGLQAVAERHGLALIFDAAHAFGCSYKGTMIGNFGSCEVFSFHATKILNTFEGGAIATNDDDLAEKVRLMTNFGFAGYDNVIHLGINGKMNEICAAMGLTNLESLQDFLDANKSNYDLYREAINGIPGVEMMSVDESEKCNWQYIVLEIKEDYPLSRDELMSRLHEQGVLARRYFWPGCHRVEPYRTKYPDADRLLPNTEAIAGRILVLPTGTAVDEQSVARIVEIIRT